MEEENIPVTHIPTGLMMDYRCLPSSDGNSIAVSIRLLPNDSYMRFMERIMKDFTRQFHPRSSGDSTCKSMHPPQCSFPSGRKFPANIKMVVHPEGRFINPAGIRYDLMVLDLMSDCEIQPPHISEIPHHRFIGQRADEDRDMSSVRLPSLGSF